MKKEVVFIIFLAFGLITFVNAEDSGGCGLGWKVTKSYTTSALSTRGTVNATFSNTLAMTSGTSGCAKHSLVINRKMDLHFIEGNYDFIVENAAVGSGEYLVGLARTLGCSDFAINSFSTKIQNNFNHIFIKNDNYIKSLKQIKQMISNDRKLRDECKRSS